MGVQKPTRHTRRLSRIPARTERVHIDVRDVLNRRAEIARASRLERTPQASSDVGRQHLPRFGRNEGDDGYMGYDVSGTGPAGVLNQPLGNERRPGMPGITVSRERMIHAEPQRLEPARTGTRAGKQRTGTK
jgi:hypothetical protein